MTFDDVSEATSGWHSPDIFVPRGMGNFGESKIFPGDPRKFPVVLEIRTFKRIIFLWSSSSKLIDKKYIKMVCKSNISLSFYKSSKINSVKLAWIATFFVKKSIKNVVFSPGKTDFFFCRGTGNAKNDFPRGFPGWGSPGTYTRSNISCSIVSNLTPKSRFNRTRLANPHYAA